MNYYGTTIPAFLTLSHTNDPSIIVAKAPTIPNHPITGWQLQDGQLILCTDRYMLIATPSSMQCS
jgi:hypothetical protein